MGGEIGQNREWQHDSSVDWHLLDYPEHAGIQALVRALNTVYRQRARVVGAGLRLARISLDQPERRGQQRAVLPPVPVGGRPQHRLRREPHAGAPPRLPDRTPASGALGGDPQLRQRGVRRQQRPRRRSHRRRPPAGTTSTTPPLSRCRPSACCGSLTSPRPTCPPRQEPRQRCDPGPTASCYPIWPRRDLFRHVVLWSGDRSSRSRRTPTSEATHRECVRRPCSPRSQESC